MTTQVHRRAESRRCPQRTPAAAARVGLVASRPRALVLGSGLASPASGVPPAPPPRRRRASEITELIVAYEPGVTPSEGTGRRDG